MMTIVLTLLILSVLIFVHEFGHMLAALLVRVRVLRFSIGFGPILASKVIKGIEFALSAVPFGGYVNLAGSEPKESGEYAPDEFLGQPVRKRIFIILAGPFANLILGFFLFLFVYGIYGQQVTATRRIAKPKEGGQLYQLGIRGGEEIIAIDDHPVHHWGDVVDLLSEKGRHRMKLVRELADTFEVVLPETLTNTIYPLIPPVAWKVVKGMPAWNAGLRDGDTIVMIDSVKIEEWEQLLEIISAHPEETLTIKWIHDGKLREGKIVPIAQVDVSDGERKVGRIGIIAPLIRQRMPIWKAFEAATISTGRAAFLIFKILGGLLTGKTPFKAVGGPIAIGKAIGQTSSRGLDSLLVLVALISINLFVINLLPIPALDGWHLVVFIAEGIARRRLPPKTAQAIQYVGFAILIALMVLITFLDITRIFHIPIGGAK